MVVLTEHLLCLIVSTHLQRQRTASSQCLWMTGHILRGRELPHHSVYGWLDIPSEADNCLTTVSMDDWTHPQRQRTASPQCLWMTGHTLRGRELPHQCLWMIGHTFRGRELPHHSVYGWLDTPSEAENCLTTVSMDGWTHLQRQRTASPQCLWMTGHTLRGRELPHHSLWMTDTPPEAENCLTTVSTDDWTHPQRQRTASPQCLRMTGHTLRGRELPHHSVYGWLDSQSSIGNQDHHNYHILLLMEIFRRSQCLCIMCWFFFLGCVCVLECYYYVNDIAFSRPGQCAGMLVLR